MSVVLVDVADLVAIVETVKADTEDVKWETQRKVVLLANLPLRSVAVLAEVVVLSLPLKESLRYRKLLEPPNSTVFGGVRENAGVALVEEGR